MEEKIIWIGRRSRKSFFASYTIAFIIIIFGLSISLGFLNIFFNLSLRTSFYASIFMISIGLVIVTVKEIKRILVKYTLTTTRIIKEEGIINKKSDYIPYQMIEKISVINKWYERILRIGSILVDTGEENFSIETIDHPENAEEIINKAMGRNVYYAQRQGYQSPQQPGYRRGEKRV